MSATATHTPGPWSAEADGSVIMSRRGIIAELADDAGTPHRTNRQPGVMQANANLMAASPRLLEACQLLVDVYYDSKPLDNKALAVAAYQAREAIAATRGTPKA